MPTLTVIQNKSKKTIEFEGERLLADLLDISDAHLEKPCGGRGVCRKCSVLVDGKSELACRYTVCADACVEIPESMGILSVTGAEETGEITNNVCLCLDIGTTTLAVALVSLDEKRIIKTKTAPNPQRKFGADVISRIECCAKRGVGEMQNVLLDKIKRMTAELLAEYTIASVPKMYVAANTTMLHIFLGVDCTSLGVSPYTPVFLDEKAMDGAALGLENVDEIITLPGISAYVGADIVAGLGYVKKPQVGKYSLLIDLGTNAETVLFGDGKYLSTTAAAGPCFEGASISSGMSASVGAVSAFCGGKYSVIGNVEPEGICATGLIDIAAELVKNGVVDDSGYMEEDFVISEDVCLTPADIRELQVAKSAVRSAVECLILRAGIGYGDIEAMYVAGGFSAELNFENAAFIGLFPQQLIDRAVCVNNSSLLGAVKYACDGIDLKEITASAEYIDLGADAAFGNLFFENMAF